MPIWPHKGKWERCQERVKIILTLAYTRQIKKIFMA
jgi:hypothetical protein